MLACLSGHTETARLLLLHVVDINDQDEVSPHAMHSARPNICIA